MIRQHGIQYHVGRSVLGHKFWGVWHCVSPSSSHLLEDGRWNSSVLPMSLESDKIYFVKIWNVTRKTHQHLGARCMQRIPLLKGIPQIREMRYDCLDFT